MSTQHQASPSRPRSSSSSSTFITLTNDSDILYPALGAHLNPTLVLSLSNLTRTPDQVSNDELFTRLLRRLEPWVGGDGQGGYELIVLAAQEDGKGRTMPGIGWWVWKWRRIPRKYRKNLKRLYLVHPSRFTRTVISVILPFLSPKAYAKIQPVPSLDDLYYTHHVSLKGIEVNLDTLLEEARVLRQSSKTSGSSKSGDRAPPNGPNAGWAYSTLTSTLSAASSYLPLPGFKVTRENSLTGKSETGRGYWRRTIEDLIKEADGKIPHLLEELSQAILSECTTTEGIFRRTSNSLIFFPLVGVLDIPPDDQPTIPWLERARDDPLLPPKVLLRFLSSLSTPVLPRDLYPIIRETTSLQALRAKLIPSLSNAQQLILTYSTHLMHHLAQHESTTRMSALGLAIVLAPTLINGPDLLEDAELCCEPGKTLPAAMLEQAGSAEKHVGADGTVVGALMMWIKDWVSISGSGTSMESEREVCGCKWGDQEQVVS